MDKETFLDSLLDLPDTQIESWLHQHRDRLDEEAVATLRARAEDVSYGGDLEGALGHIQQAKSILDDLGASMSVEELETTIRKINIEILDARIQSRQAVVEGLEAQIEACRERLKQLESRLKMGDLD